MIVTTSILNFYHDSENDSCKVPVTIFDYSIDDIGKYIGFSKWIFTCIFLFVLTLKLTGDDKVISVHIVTVKMKIFPWYTYLLQQNYNVFGDAVANTIHTKCLPVRQIIYVQISILNTKLPVRVTYNLHTVSSKSKSSMREDK